MSDLIDRQAVLDGIEELKGSPWFNDNTNGARIIRREALNIVEDLCIRDLPSVTPTERIGHWTNRYNEVFKYYCDKCGTGSDLRTNYCPNCGCRMVEPQESEEISDTNLKMWEELFKAESEDKE